MEGKEERSADCQTAAAQQTGLRCARAQQLRLRTRAVHAALNGIGGWGQQPQQGLSGR